MKEVWVLQASQGTYSDRHDWIINIYTSVEACMNDPLNEKIPPFKRMENYEGYYKMSMTL